ncbi:3-deoxy-D-manno-octulosonic acid transferase [Stappia sp. ES.058]|uniref:3-deoxy-D-manno-octulosonic acid transferase n=1 Tax=Stappia sp. ES.058 TaxID=1881061 RepID=UPI00087D5383|nr:3-deoxy-D-manno-octulosonic acid transferase [Stappia sp. ES.058]SDT91731.1 3-deoxy-D-manno-octulosonic-acid transferase [Stappia sp. ES.058]
MSQAPETQTPGAPVPSRPAAPSRWIGAAALAGYRAFGHIANPGLALLFRRRAARGKEDGSRRGERFGRASCARPVGRLVWLHAASVGEMNAADALIDALIGRGLNVLLTTGTVTSARIAASRTRAGITHQFVPYDTAPNLERFLAHWRPDLAVTMESEIWPATIAALSGRQIPFAIVSATMSERTSRGWARARGLAWQVFSRIDLCLAQTREDAQRMAALGARRVAVAGNLKYDSGSLKADPQALADLKHAIGERPTWLAASTHDGEESLIDEVHRTAAAALPGLLTLLVPRHPHRGDGIASDLRASGLRVAQRSRGEPLAADTDVYLADTIGEMGLFYRLAPVAFIGKSLVPEGGQNPLEAARLDTAILTGPHVFNLEDIYTPLLSAKGAQIVRDAQSLGAAVVALLRDPGLRARRADVAAEVSEAGAGALAATLHELSTLLPDGDER